MAADAPALFARCFDSVPLLLWEAVHPAATIMQGFRAFRQEVRSFLAAHGIDPLSVGNRDLIDAWLDECRANECADRWLREWLGAGEGLAAIQHAEQIAKGGDQ